MPKRRTKDRAAPQGALCVAERAGRRAFVAVFSWSVLQMLFRLAFAGAFAVFVGEMVQGSTLDVAALAGAVGSLILAVAIGYLADRSIALKEGKLAVDLRGAAGGRLAQLPTDVLRARSVGDMVVALERYPAQIARLVLSHRLAARMMSLGPLIAAAAVSFVSWEAALTLFLVTPVMIVFFVLAGSLIRSRAEAQERALARLAAQFGDRIRTLPTILANHAVESEHAKLEARMRAYAEATMKVLGVAFLNSGIIDFFSSLSIAILAIFLGLGHLGLIHVPGFSDLRLWQSLFVLMIAPDYFAPFRRYAEQYHAKAEGMAAAAALDWLFVPEATLEDGRPAHNDGRAEISACVTAVLETCLPAAGLVAITGASGSGKSTCLRAFAGLEPGFQGRFANTRLCWVAGDIHVPAGTLSEAIGCNAEASPQAIADAARASGLLDDPYLPQGLASPVHAGGENLSGGQLMRLAVARALLGDGIIIADEPTAKLDPASADRVRLCLLEAVARGRLVIVATHDGELARMAQTVIDMEAVRAAPERQAA